MQALGRAGEMLLLRDSRESTELDEIDLNGALLDSGFTGLPAIPMARNRSQNKHAAC
jgi:hypothetical protein